jgi:hypothetical protein
MLPDIVRRHHLIPPIRNSKIRNKNPNTTEHANSAAEGIPRLKIDRTTANTPQAAEKTAAAKVSPAMPAP